MDAPLVEPAGIIREAVAVYRTHFAILFPLALVVGLVQAIALLALRDTGAEFLALGIAMVASMLFQGVTVEVVQDVRSGGRERSVGQLLRAVTPILVPLFLASILLGVGVAVGLLLLIVPGLILLTIWAVVAPVVIVERPGVLAAFGRSSELVRGHGRQVFGVVLTVLLLVLVAAIVSAAFTTDDTNIAGSFAQLVITALVTPLGALATAVLYFRLVQLHERRDPGPRADDVPPARESDPV